MGKRCFLFLLMAWPSALLAGCGDCARPVVFDLRVVDSQAAPIAAAHAEVQCTETTGAVRANSTASDGGGRALVPRITSARRACPDNPELIAPYFESCRLSVTADGFQNTTQTLTGAEMDSLSTPAGDGARIVLVVPLLRAP